MGEADQLGPSYDATVVLDIGDDIGALIITTSPELHLVEIEISPLDDDAAHPAAQPHVHEHGDAEPHSHRPGDAEQHVHGHGDAEQHVHGHGDAEQHVHGHGDAEQHVHAHGDAHQHSKRTHVAVRERRGPSGVRYAAIYPELREGVYTIYDAQGAPADTARIVGGEITELDWR